MTMSFDLLDWDPVQPVGPDYRGMLTMLVALICIGVPGSFVCCGTFDKLAQQTKLRKYRVPARILAAIFCVTATGTLIALLATAPAPPTPQTTTLGAYIGQQAQAYTPALTDVQCETPVPGDKYAFVEQEGRYPCTWRFDGEPVTGSVHIAYSRRRSLFTYPKATATLLDAHGDAWCPTDWKTQYGCEPILADGNRAATPTTPEETR